MGMLPLGLLLWRFVTALCILGSVSGSKSYEVSAALAHFEFQSVAEYGGGGDLCSVDLKSFLPPPYNTISSDLACTPIWNTFVLRYTQNKDNVMTIVLSAAYTTGWVGIGFSKDGTMVGSSAMVGWLNKEGKSRIKQFYLQGRNKSQVLAGKGELPLTNVPPVVVLYGPFIYLAFQMKFQNHIARQPLIMAFGTATPKHHHLTHHDAKTSMLFDFSQGSSSSQGLSANIGHMKTAHGVLGLIGWGLILPVGSIIARYLKHRDPLWYYLHTIIQLVGFMVILAGVVVGQQLYNTLHIHIPSHRGIGIFALVLVILQVLAFFLRPSKDAKIRNYWNSYHHWFGRIALFFGAVNIVLGIHVGGEGNDWKIGYGFLLATVLVAVIVLEILKRLRSSEKPSQSATFQMNPVQ